MKLSAKIFLEERFRYILGPGRIELLKATAALGSLHKAAQALGMSYRWAWGRVRDSEKELGFHLLIPRPSAGRGRGAPKMLSPEGQALLAWYQKAEKIIALGLKEALAAFPPELGAKMAAGDDGDDNNDGGKPGRGNSRRLWVDRGPLMTIHVRLSTTLRQCVPDYRPAYGLTLTPPGPLTAADLARQIGLPLGQIKVVMLNGRQVPLETMVNDGDRVGYFPAVGGG